MMLLNGQNFLEGETEGNAREGERQLRSPNHLMQLRCGG
jgi:hypothetical protein